MERHQCRERPIKTKLILYIILTLLFSFSFTSKIINLNSKVLNKQFIVFEMQLSLKKKSLSIIFRFDLHLAFGGVKVTFRSTQSYALCGKYLFIFLLTHLSIHSSPYSSFYSLFHSCLVTYIHFNYQIIHFTEQILYPFLKVFLSSVTSAIHFISLLLFN